MKQFLSRFSPARPEYFIAIIIAALLIIFSLSALMPESSAAEETHEQTPQEQSGYSPPLPRPVKTKAELYPANVEVKSEGNTRYIVKTYILSDAHDPSGISREEFSRDGWNYNLTDITENQAVNVDRRTFKETVSFNSESSDFNEILKQLSPTLEYKSEDGYQGLLALDLSSVNCEIAGQHNSSYTVTATREYPSLSSNDLSLIPKSITENGRTYQLDDVNWEAQNYSNVDYINIPDSYRAVARYTGTASRTVITGYTVTAEYFGEITKERIGETVYQAHFTGSHAEPLLKGKPIFSENNLIPLMFLLILLVLLAGAAAFLHFRHNVKVYSGTDGHFTLIAKYRITAKNPVIDLTPLRSHTKDECFKLEIDKYASKRLNQKNIKIIYGSKTLQHTLAFEGKPYIIEADFHGETVKAIH
jgi:hypothetical protein